jgi:hypothetical protein
MNGRAPCPAGLSSAPVFSAGRVVGELLAGPRPVLVHEVNQGLREGPVVGAVGGGRQQDDAAVVQVAQQPGELARGYLGGGADVDAVLPGKVKRSPGTSSL